MKRIFGLLCFLTLFLLASVGFALKNHLPSDRNLIFQERYDSWSGVVRVWVYEGWKPGASSLTRWLNSCANAYERQNDGQYLYITTVPLDAMLSIASGEFILPDLVFFPPGLFESDSLFSDLSIVTNSSNLRSEFSSLSDTVVPVAMGGYAWMSKSDTDLYAGLSSVSAAAPPDSSFRTFSAAAILSCTYTVDNMAESTPDPAALDIGLPESPLPTSAPQSHPSPQNGQKTFLGPDFRFSEVVLSDFADGGSDAVLLTQSEISRLTSLSLPSYSLSYYGTKMLADQLLLAAMPSTDEGRSTAAMDFISFLLSDSCQKNLSAAGCFSVTGQTGLYPPGTDMGKLESYISSATLAVPPAFSAYWRETAPRLFERCRAGELDAFSTSAILF